MTYYTANCRCGNQALFDVSETLDGMAGNYCRQCGQDDSWVSVRKTTQKELEERGLGLDSHLNYI
jgi:hypothetical protein